jgi:hypothetical protein
LINDLPEGKTTFLWYFLIRALSARQTILFYAQTDLFLHHEGGVHRFESTDINLFHASHLICLVDMDYHPNAPQPQLQSKSDLFIIGATSPKLVRYYDWRKQNDLMLLIMDIPQITEIKWVVWS